MARIQHQPRDYLLVEVLVPERVVLHRNNCHGAQVNFWMSDPLG